MSHYLANPRRNMWASFPFETARRELDRIFSNAESGAGGALAPLTVWEDKDYFHVEMELPGFSREQIDITVEKHELRIKAERPAPEGERKVHREERFYGAVQRTLSLPETVDAEGIEAELKEGVLWLKLAKRPEAQPKRIEVKLS